MSPRYSAARLAETLGQPSPTEQQIAVIEAPLDRAALVVAGAGSGKTETMAARVVWLIANGLVELPEVLGLTFTRKAAGELAERVRRRINQLAAAGIGSRIDPFHTAEISTYHAFAAGVYRDHALSIARDPDAVVLSEASAWMLAREVVLRSGDLRLAELEKRLDAVVEAVLKLAREMSENDADGIAIVDYVGAMTTSLRSLPKAARQRNEFKAEVAEALAAVAPLPLLVELAEAYQREKRQRGMVEFSDQVSLAGRIVSADPALIEQYRSRYRMVILDEYQDTDVGQIGLLTTLFAGTPVMAVGDPNQAIYGWRGASEAGLASFSESFTGSGLGSPEGAHAYELSTSWRNDRIILDAANQIAAPLRTQAAVPVLALEARPAAAAGQLSVEFLPSIEDEARSLAQWLAEQLRGGAAADAQPSAAVLLRSLKGVAVYTRALAEAGVPFRVLGLGGLLEEPAVVDLVATLKVLHSTEAGPELIRLLSGARWRIGIRDLDALRGLARWLEQRDPGQQPLDESVAERLRRSVAVEEHASIVDALDFLSTAPEGHSALRELSTVGLARLREAGAFFASLRRRVGLGLSELVAVVSQELLLDIETAANPSRPTGPANLEAFAQQVHGFQAANSSAALGAFLSWLREAEQRDTMTPRAEEPEPGTVQLLTIHGSKGLEWDVVAVPGMVDENIPKKPRTNRGWLSLGALPYELRKDAATLPRLRWAEAVDQGDFAAIQAEFVEALTDRRLAEERRLAYVALTRARRALRLSGAYWDTRSTQRRPSPFLQELGAAGLLEQAVAEAGPERVEVDAAVTRVTWPRPALGTREAGVRAAAAAVRAADPDAPTPWSDDLELLLAERARRWERSHQVTLPKRIPASRFKDFVHSPAEVATGLRRPMPERPYRQTRLGTLFHSWVEQRSGMVGQSEMIDAEWHELDPELLPAAASAGDSEALQALQRTFERSEWAERAPEAVEIEIHLPLAGQIVICKIDAVYAVEGGYQIVDWKTGKAPRDADDLERKQLQLALYRLAYAEWRGIDPASIDAVFYFVADDLVIRPERVYDRSELEDRWKGVAG